MSRPNRLMFWLTAVFYESLNQKFTLQREMVDRLRMEVATNSSVSIDALTFSTPVNPQLGLNILERCAGSTGKIVICNSFGYMPLSRLIWQVMRTGMQIGKWQGKDKRRFLYQHVEVKVPQPAKVWTPVDQDFCETGKQCAACKKLVLKIKVEPRGIFWEDGLVFIRKGQLGYEEAAAVVRKILGHNKEVCEDDDCLLGYTRASEFWRPMP